MSSRASDRTPPLLRALRLLGELIAVAALLFVARFIGRHYLVTEMDQECHIGGIAVDVLAHGIRFPLLAYAPNDYDNGSFFSGLLAALSFSMFGRNLLALKLVTHAISAAGVVAALALLRACLVELRLESRLIRALAIATLLYGFAMAPTLVTALSMYAVGNHPEGSAIDTILLAVFASRVRTRSAASTAAIWGAVGLALYLNKGTVLVLPVLVAAEFLVARRNGARLAAALVGFAIGVLPELLVTWQRHGLGWANIADKAERNSRMFPESFLTSVAALADRRPALLIAWGIALAVGFALFRSTVRTSSVPSPGALPERPIVLGLVLGVTCSHLLMLMAMARLGTDPYAIYAFPTLTVLFAVLAATGIDRASRRWGPTGVALASLCCIGMTLASYPPFQLHFSTQRVDALWHNRRGAACAWRFAEGFEREQRYGLAPPGRTAEEHAIERCRSLSEPDLVLDCIGGIARELNWRQNRHVGGEPPPGLSADERRAYAYHYGTHRKGDVAACDDFTSAELRAECAAAVELECLVFADHFTRGLERIGLARPHCDLPPPPMSTYWAAMRDEFLARSTGARPDLSRVVGEDTLLLDCKPMLAACY